MKRYMSTAWLLFVSFLCQDSSAFYVNPSSGYKNLLQQQQQQQLLQYVSRLTFLLQAKKKETENEATGKIDPLSKASWYAVEAFGNLFGSQKRQSKEADSTTTTTTTVISLDEPPSSLQETLQRIQDDFERDYFLSGQVDALIYDEDCTFSDPFVSFNGRDRFITNLANLGSFITKYSVRPLTFDATDPTLVNTKVMVKLELGLPWRPILAWPWGVEYTIDSDTFLITKHKETWDIAPIEGVKQIFRKPTLKID